MAYANKAQDHQKRRDQEGSYSLYNHLYNWLLNEYEPAQLKSSSLRASVMPLIIEEAASYCIKGGKKIDKSELEDTAKEAMRAFVENDGKHGDTAGNFGNSQENSFDTVKRSLYDLRW